MDILTPDYAQGKLVGAEIVTSPVDASYAQDDVSGF